VARWARRAPAAPQALKDQLGLQALVDRPDPKARWVQWVLTGRLDPPDWPDHRVPKAQQVPKGLRAYHSPGNRASAASRVP